LNEKMEIAIYTGSSTVIIENTTSVNEATFMNNSGRCSLGFKKPLPWSDWSHTSVSKEKQ